MDLLTQARAERDRWARSSPCSKLLPRPPPLSRPTRDEVEGQPRFQIVLDAAKAGGNDPQDQGAPGREEKAAGRQEGIGLL